MHFAHGALDVQRLDILPSLLQERDEEVDGHLDVDGQVLRLEGDVADRNADTQNLLELELDGALEVVDFLFHVLGVGDEDREFVRFVQMRTKQTGNLTDDRIRSQEAVVLGCELLDRLFLLVFLHVTVLLQLLEAEEGKSELLGLVTVLLIAENTKLVLGLGDVGQFDGTAETLVLLGIVVLEADLKLNRLHELTLGLD